MEKEQK
jgi:hypothetical protein